MKTIKPLINFFLILSFIYLLMCPFAQALTPNDSSSVLIPQNQAVENLFRQKDLIIPSLHFFPKNQIAMWTHDNKTGVLPLTASQKPVLSLFIITTTRLTV